METSQATAVTAEMEGMVEMAVARETMVVEGLAEVEEMEQAVEVLN